jgi:hypothetical protein
MTTFRSLIVLVVIIVTSISSFAADIEVYESSLKKYCLCKLPPDGSYPIPFDYQQIYASNEKYKTCFDRLAKIFYVPNAGQYHMMTVGGDVDHFEKQGVFCSKNQNVQWIVKYEALVKTQTSNDDKDLNKICENDKNAIIPTCSAKLQSLVKLLDVKLEEKCKEDINYGNKTNECVIFESKRRAVLASKQDYYQSFCKKISHDEINATKACENKIEIAVQQSLKDSEVLDCAGSDIRPAPKAKIACYNLFFSKIFFQNSKEIDRNKCLEQALKSGNFNSCNQAPSSEEARLLSELKDKYCTPDDKQAVDASFDANKCLKDLIELFANDFQTDEKCVQEFAGDIDKIVQCQKEQMYEELKKKEELSLYNCFSNPKFTKFEEKNACYNIEKSLYAQLETCKNKENDQAKDVCFKALLAEQKNKGVPQNWLGEEIINNYLKSKTSSNLVMSQCASIQNESEKLLCSLYPNATAYTQTPSGTNTAGPNSASPFLSTPGFSPDIAGFNGNGSNLGTAGLISTGLGATSLIANSNSNSNSAQGASNQRSSSQDCSKKTGDDKKGCEESAANPAMTAGGSGASTNGDARINSNTLAGGNDGFMGLLKDLQYRRMRPLDETKEKDRSEPCNVLKRAANARVAGKILATLTVIGTGVAVQKEIAKNKDSNDHTDKGLKPILIMGSGALAAYGIGWLANHHAESIITPSLMTELTAADGRGEPVNCRMNGKKGKESTTTSFDPFILKHKEQLHKKIQSEIASANNMAQFEIIRADIDRLIDGEIQSTNIDEYNNRLASIDQLYIDESDFTSFKTAYSLVTKYAPQLFFDDAFAAEDTTNPIWEKLKSALPMVLMAVTMSSMSRQTENGSRNNSRSSEDESTSPEKSTTTNTTVAENSSTTSVKNEQIAKESTKTTQTKLDSNIKKFDALTLLYDYKQTILMTKTGFLNQRKKKMAELAETKAYMNQTDPSKQK